LVAICIRDDAVSTRNALVRAEVRIEVGRTFYASTMEHAALTFIVEEGTTKFTHPIEVAFFDLMGRADPKPTKFTHYLFFCGQSGARQQDRDNQCR
jgi:hypothetical protein